MNTGKNNWKRNSVAVYPAFFAIGLVETLFPRLKWQISFVFQQEYSLRILTFTGLLVLAFLSVLFGMIRTGKGNRVNLTAALLVVLSGLLILLFDVKPGHLVLLIALCLFAGSLFVQVAGLNAILAANEKGRNIRRIVLLYCIKTFGFMAGISVPAILPSTLAQMSGLLPYAALFFILLSVALLFLLPFKVREETIPGKHITYTIGQLLHNKNIILMLGGLLVYSGAEACLVNLIPFYFSEIFGIKILQMIIPGVGLFIFSFVAGRIAGVLILFRTRPETVFLYSSVLSVLGLFTMFIGQKYLSLAATVMIGIGSANIFPLMIGLAMDLIQHDKKVLLGMMTGTIPVSAFFTSLMWAVTDSVSITMSFMVPVFCMFYITWIAILLVKRN